MPYPLNRCKTLSDMTKVADQFLYTLQHLPGGYVFWYSLPHKGRQARQVLRKRLIHAMVTASMPPALQRAMLLACYDANGRPAPQAKQLYDYVCTNMYQDDPGRMVRAWVHLVQGDLP